MHAWDIPEQDEAAAPLVHCSPEVRHCQFVRLSKHKADEEFDCVCQMVGQKERTSKEPRLPSGGVLYNKRRGFGSGVSHRMTNLLGEDSQTDKECARSPVRSSSWLSSFNLVTAAEYSGQ